jgi:hypothetical protein
MIVATDTTDVTLCGTCTGDDECGVSRTGGKLDFREAFRCFRHQEPMSPVGDTCASSLVAAVYRRRRLLGYTNQ